MPYISSNKKSLNSLKYLAKYLMPYKGMLFMMFIALCVTSLSVLLLSKSIQYIIDNGIADNDAQALNNALIYLLLIVIVLGIGTAVRYALITIVGERAIADLRQDLFNKTVNLPISYLEKYGLGEFTSRIVNDTTVLQSIITSTLSIAIRNILLLFGGIVMLLWLNPRLTGLILVTILLVVFPIIVFGRKTRIVSKVMQDKIADLTSSIEEATSYIKVIQSYQRADYEAQKFSQKLHNVIRAALDRIKIRSILITLVIILVFSAIVFVLWTGGHDVLNGRSTSGELSGFIFLSIVCAGAFGALTDTFGELQKASGATERLVEVLEYTNPLKADRAHVGESILGSSKLSLSFKNVTFGYKGSTPILKDISFNIEEGKRVAVVGESGSGKSSILQLILKFYEAQSGKVLVNGMNITDIDSESLRSQVAYVPQEAAIFSGSIRENIAYGRLDATEEEIYQAAKDAALMDFINSLPDGLSHQAGPKGGKLSGGEKQRISLARAFLKSPKLLLLDEITSAVDAHNEELIIQALDKLSKDKTLLMVSHRLSTIKRCDEIIVLDKGAIVEQGTHEELINKGSHYTRLMQFSYA